MKIGIFDDTKDMRILIRDFLEDEGHQVISSVGRPHQLVKIDEYEVLIMDVKTPDDRYAGINFVEEERSKGNLHSTEVIFISNFGRDSPEIKGLLSNVGSFKWLDKPLEFAELKKILEAIT